MTYDVQRIKESIDCRDIVAQDLGEPKHKSGAYNLYKCPMHHEQNGFSFAVYRDHWHCFGGKCGKSGDVIEWVMWARGALNFHEACRILAGDLVDNKTRPIPPAKPPANMPALPPSGKWQWLALEVVERAVDLLWSAQGEQHLDYLRGRGLTDATIKRAYLGSIPGLPEKWHFWEGLSIPPGIAIPRFAELELWGIKIRQFGGDQKYVQVGTVERSQAELGKGALAGGLYWADHIEEGKPLVICEGEIDALTLWQECGDLVSVVTMGASSSAINPRWYKHLGVVKTGCLIACFDPDAAGEKGAARLGAMAPFARLVNVPEGKDPNGFFMLHGGAALREWIAGVLSPELA